MIGARCRWYHPGGDIRTYPLDVPGHRPPFMQLRTVRILGIVQARRRSRRQDDGDLEILAPDDDRRRSAPPPPPPRLPFGCLATHVRLPLQRLYRSPSSRHRPDLRHRIRNLPLPWRHAPLRQMRRDDRTALPRCRGQGRGLGRERRRLGRSRTRRISRPRERYGNLLLFRAGPPVTLRRSASGVIVDRRVSRCEPIRVSSST